MFRSFFMKQFFAFTSFLPIFKANPLSISLLRILLPILQANSQFLFLSCIFLYLFYTPIFYISLSRLFPCSLHRTISTLCFYFSHTCFVSYGVTAVSLKITIARSLRDGMECKEWFCMGYE